MENEGRAYRRTMGLDVGERTLGVALSDELGWTAQPFGTLRRRSLPEDLQALRRLVEEHRVSGIVVGLPKDMRGSLGPQARSVMALAKTIEAEVRVPVTLWDERLSTVAAERVLLAADLSRQKRKKQVDKIAAALILQGYLDCRRTGSGSRKGL